MKNKKIVLIILMVLMLCGCTKNLKDEKGKIVTNTITGQTVTENIMCKPNNKDIIKLYKDNKVDINKLPECSKMKIAGTYEGLWNTIFVRPLAFIIIKIGHAVKSYGLGLILITIILRLILYPVTKKTAIQSEKMKEVQPKLTKLEEKYKDKTSQEDQMKKSQEMMLIYKENNINPVSGCLMAFLQIPILFAFLEAINRVPAIFEEKFLFFDLGKTPWVAMAGGEYIYILLIIAIGAVTYFSFKNTANDTAALGPSTKTMSIFMTIFIVFASLRLSTAITIYWIVSSGFTVFQNELVKRGNKDVRKA